MYAQSPHRRGQLFGEKKQRSQSIGGFQKHSLGQKCRAVCTGPRERALRAEWREGRVTSQHQSKPCPSEDQAVEDVHVPCLLFQNSILTSVSLGFIVIPFYWEDNLSFCSLFTMSGTALPLLIKRPAVFLKLFSMIQDGTGQMRTNGLVFKLKRAERYQ